MLHKHCIQISIVTFIALSLALVLSICSSESIMASSRNDHNNQDKKSHDNNHSRADSRNDHNNQDKKSHDNNHSRADSRTIITIRTQSQRIIRVIEQMLQLLATRI